MTAKPDSGERDVVPRWRSVRRTIEAGEFQTRDARPMDPAQADELVRLGEIWRLTQSRRSALEFIEAAVVADEPGIASTAARELLATDSSGLPAAMALRVETGEVEHPLLDSRGGLPDRAYRRIALTKTRLKANPRSPILWGDLARRYTSLGQFDHAEHALRVARALAPHSRYLLRSHVRFLVHVGRADEAVRVLERSPRTNGDPWLMAALLSVAQQAKRPTPGRKHVRRLLEDDNFRLIERSELASEAGTFEMREGADKQGTRLLRSALDNPTDNSLAQVEWVSNRFHVIDVDLSNIAIPFADEAFARDALQAGSWDGAIAHVERWMDDQPFDASAAILGSYAASVGLEDWERAIAIARAGLLASPYEPMLRNNLAFALIENGELAEAEAQLGTVMISQLQGPPRTAAMATRGLLAFRSGEAEAGTDLYRAAVAQARRDKDRDAEAMALSMLVGEIARVGDSEALPKLIDELSRAVRGVRETGVKLAIQRAQRAAELRIGPSD